jgi:Mn2+/Fe2+ NRAMP family transporter
MKKLFEISLGILASIGGFVDIGDLVFVTGAGALFGYQLLWAIAVGMIGIAAYAEMCGRVATVTNRPVFDVIRERLGFGFGLCTLIASQLMNVITLTAELGGVALVLELLTGWPYRLLIPAAALILLLTIWVMSFSLIEKVYGFGGLMLLVFAVVALKLHPHWHSVAAGFVPHFGHTTSYLIWAYFAVGLISTSMMPYEVFFYSSGAIEEGWLPPSELSLNKLTSFLGFGLGGLLSMSILVAAAEFFFPRGIDPQFLGTTAIAALATLGEIGLLLALAGMLLAVGGAAIDTAFAGAYAPAQFFGWRWGKWRRPSETGRFTLTWLTLIAVAVLVLLTGANPVNIAEIAVIFSAVAMPLTYMPVFFVARDRGYMGKYANGRLANTVGWIYLGIILLLSMLAVPLLILTNMGQG